MLAWVGRWLLDAISPSIRVLSECFFQLQTLQIVMHNMVLDLAWSSPSCSTINHKPLHLQTLFSVSILSKCPNHQSHICSMTTVMSQIPGQILISYFFRGSFLRQANATHPSSHLHFCPLDSVGVFHLNCPYFTAIEHSTPDTSFINISFHFIWKYSRCQKWQYFFEFLLTCSNLGYWACF